MNITSEMVKELRDSTGISVMQCKKALEQANGDMDSAREILKSFSESQAEKKSDRELAAGVIGSYVHNNKKTATIVELLCETDFVAQNPEFVTCATQLAMHITAMNPGDETELLAQSFIMNPDMTVLETINGLTQKTGERIMIGNFTRLEIA